MSKFANGETSVVIQESIRGKDVYIVQSICSNLNQSNFIKHARNNSNSNLNTSIRSPSSTLIKAPSFSNLPRSNSSQRANIAATTTSTAPSEPALNINNALLDHVKNLGDNTTFFSPELNPARLIPRDDVDAKPSSSSMKAKSTPTSPRNPAPAYVTSPPATPQQPTSSSSSVSSTPKAVLPLSLPATPNQPTTASSVSTPPNTNITPNPSPRGVALTRSKSTPGSPIPMERLVISHSTTKDSDMHNWSANDSLMELLIMGDAFKVLISLLSFFYCSK